MSITAQCGAGWQESGSSDRPSRQSTGVVDGVVNRNGEGQHVSDNGDNHNHITSRR